MLEVKGSGILYINGEEIPFENKVNDAFVMAAQAFIDEQRLSGNFVGQGTRACYAKIFTLMSNPADASLSAVYNRIGHIPINAFNVIKVTPRKTTIRGGGIITANGTVRSAGFNVLCAETPVSGNVPLFNLPLRRVELRIDGVASVPFVNNWVYVPVKQALYRYEANSQDIWKIPFDATNGTIGTPVQVANNFGGQSTGGGGYPVTNGVDKLVRWSSSTLMHIFDFITETASSVTMSASVSGATSQSARGWDETVEKFIVVSGTQLSHIELDGTVTQTTRESFSYEDLWVVKDGYAWDGRWLRSQYASAQLGQIGLGDSWVQPQQIFDKMYRFPDSDKWMLTGTFNSLSTPGIITLQYMREPDTSMSIINIPAQTVEVDTPFTVDYTFEVTDTR
jgi:hypothetical protein